LSQIGRLAWAADTRCRECRHLPINGPASDTQNRFLEAASSGCLLRGIQWHPDLRSLPQDETLGLVAAAMKKAFAAMA
jgi:hypothetical protein